MKIGRLVLILLACLATVVTQAQTTRQIRNLQSQSKSLKQQISESETLLRSTKKDVRSQLNNLALLNGQIDNQRKYVASIENDVKALDSSIVSLSGELKKLQAELDECKRKYARSVMYMYRNRTTQNKLMFLFSAKNFSQMFRRMRYMAEYAKYQRIQGEVIRQKEATVRSKQNELLEAKSQKGRLLAAGREEQVKLEGQQKERQGIVAELQKKQSKLQATIAQTRKRYNSLNAKIDRLIQQEIEAAERRRKQTPKVVPGISVIKALLPAHYGGKTAENENFAVSVEKRLEAFYPFAHRCLSTLPTTAVALYLSSKLYSIACKTS